MNGDYMEKLNPDFYRQDALSAAPALLGKILVRRLPCGTVIRCRITETEAYCGEKDLACHARAGRTSRTAPLYMAGGHTYVYLCYGLHHLFNVVTGAENAPQAVLIRAGTDLASGKSCDGPAKLTRFMQIDMAQNRVNMPESGCLWIEEGAAAAPAYRTTPRVGISNVPEPYKSLPWRFVAK